jgi:hypothetical protein
MRTTHLRLPPDRARCAEDVKAASITRERVPVTAHDCAPAHVALVERTAGALVQFYFVLDEVRFCSDAALTTLQSVNTTACAFAHSRDRLRHPAAG